MMLATDCHMRSHRSYKTLPTMFSSRRRLTWKSSMNFSATILRFHERLPCAWQAWDLMWKEKRVSLSPSSRRHTSTDSTHCSGTTRRRSLLMRRPSGERGMKCVTDIYRMLRGLVFAFSGKGKCNHKIGNIGKRRCVPSLELHNFYMLLKHANHTSSQSRNLYSYFNRLQLKCFSHLISQFPLFNL